MVRNVILKEWNEARLDYLLMILCTVPSGSLHSFVCPESRCPNKNKSQKHLVNSYELVKPLLVRVYYHWISSCWWYVVTTLCRSTPYILQLDLTCIFRFLLETYSGLVSNRAVFSVHTANSEPLQRVAHSRNNDGRVPRVTHSPCCSYDYILSNGNMLGIVLYYETIFMFLNFT